MKRVCLGMTNSLNTFTLLLQAKQGLFDFTHMISLFNIFLWPTFTLWVHSYFAHWLLFCVLSTYVSHCWAILALTFATSRATLRPYYIRHLYITLCTYWNVIYTYHFSRYARGNFSWAIYNAIQSVYKFVLSNSSHSWAITGLYFITFVNSYIAFTLYTKSFGTSRVF